MSLKIEIIEFRGKDPLTYVEVDNYLKVELTLYRDLILEWEDIFSKSNTFETLYDFIFSYVWDPDTCEEEDYRIIYQPYGEKGFLTYQKDFKLIEKYFDRRSFLTIGKEF